MKNNFKKAIDKIEENGFKITLGASVLALIVSTLPALSGCTKKDKTETNQTTVEELANELTSLINSLKYKNQIKAFTKINSVQDYFNNTAAPSIRNEYDKIDEENYAQLYLKSKEVLALYVYGNADTLTEETLAIIFGNNELLDENELLNNFTKVGQVLNTYYRYATKTSGIGEIFEAEENKKLFNEFENLVLEYNKKQTEENKKKISDKLTEIFISGKIDSLKDSCSEAASFIATFITPSIYERTIIDEELYNSIIKINETITCDNIKANIKEAIEISKTKETDDRLIKIIKLMDEKNIKVSSRDINIEAREEAKYQYANEKNESNVIGNKTSKSTKTKIGNSKDSGIREKVVEEFGEKTVSEAESKADVEFSIKYTNENKKQGEYAKGLSDGYAISYEKSYDAYINENKTLTASFFQSQINNKVSNYNGEYLEEYKKGLTEGLARGISLGLSNAKKDKKKMEEEIKKTIPTTEVATERVTEKTKEEPTKKEETTTKKQSTTEPTKSGIIEYTEIVTQRVYESRNHKDVLEDDNEEVTEINEENYTRVRK